MSIEQSVFNNSKARRQPESVPAREADASDPEQDAARRMDAIVARVDSDLRASSALANDLVVRSWAITSTTAEMVACAWEAIARSRALLDETPAPGGRNREGHVADLSSPLDIFERKVVVSTIK